MTAPLETSQPSFAPAPSILAAVDLSEAAAFVVQEALQMAREKHASQLHFLHVNHADQKTQDQDARHAELLEWLGARIGAGAATCKLVAHELRGDPAQLILEQARELDVDVIVVGTRGRSRLERLLLGSVASAVVQRAPCPVLVARPKLGPSAPEIEPPCPECVATRERSHGEELWCEQHREKHGRRHTYYDPRASTWSSHRITI